MPHSCTWSLKSLATTVSSFLIVECMPATPKWSLKFSLYWLQTSGTCLFSYRAYYYVCLHHFIVDHTIWWIYYIRHIAIFTSTHHPGHCHNIFAPSLATFKKPHSSRGPTTLTWKDLIPILNMLSGDPENLVLPDDAFRFCSVLQKMMLCDVRILPKGNECRCANNR